MSDHAVYIAIAAITGELAKVGIAKGRRNNQQGYQFRGIDDVYAALSSLLASHALCVIPRVMGRTVSERESKNGGTLFYAIVDVEFDLVSAKDGSKHTARIVGEAMDSGDKATNKAMSAAYKYFALQTFCIPTEGDNDADAQTHEPVKPKVDTKQVNIYADRINDAVNQGADDRIMQLWGECSDNHEFGIAVWACLTRPVQNRIRDLKDRKAA